MWILGRTYLFALAECNSEFPGPLMDTPGLPNATRSSRGRCWILAALAVCRLQVGDPGPAEYNSEFPGPLLDTRCARSVPTASRRSRPAECNSEFPGPLPDARCARSVPTASRRSRPAECNSEFPGPLMDTRCARSVPTASRRSRPAECNSEFPGPLPDARCARGMPTASRRSRACRAQLGVPGAADGYSRERYWMVRSCGKRMTSRMEAESVNSITSRSMPMPSPAVGGSAYSSARM